MAVDLPLPPHWDPTRVGEIWRVDYEQRAHDAERWGRQWGAATPGTDDPRVALLIVDAQNTFCTPGFELFVPGAPDDNLRLCEFVYRNLGAITRIFPTLDTHRAMQVFHAAWLVNAEGRHPAPYTVVSAEDVKGGVWWATEPAEQQALLDYVEALEAKGRYQLTIWPYHAMLGGIGHALVSAVEEAVFFHTIARGSQPSFQVKGDDPHTEHYSALGDEVGGHRNTELIAELLQYDRVLVAGQAKSHCVAWTVEDLLEDVAPEKIVLLEDCTSPVCVPDAVDFTDQANAAVAGFAARGVKVVRSTDPVASWLS